VCHKIKSSIVA